MNLTGIIRIKEKVAISNDFMPEERDFILDAINAVVLLKDPVAVHANMLSGGIAKPNWNNIKHLYPEQFANEPHAASLTEALEAADAFIKAEHEFHTHLGRKASYSDNALADAARRGERYKDTKKKAEKLVKAALARPQTATSSCGCIFCDLDIELHEDAKGFHHRIKGERIACPRDKS